MQELKQGKTSFFRLLTAACLALGGATAAAGELFAEPGLPSLGNFRAAPAYSLLDEPPLTYEDPLWRELNGFTHVGAVPPQESRDLLKRLRRGFSLPAIINRRVEAELNWYVRHPEYLNRVFTRAQRYLPYIVDEVEARGLPLDLALLPVVESAFDPFAYSHGRAAGLWQIIPGTGRRFGIRQNWWYDGRRDIVDSTRGALDYLNYLHELMDGDWLLAIASYNSGEGNVLRAVRKNKARSQSTDFFSLSLSKETRAYVPRLIALVAIVKNPGAFGLTLPALVDEPQFAVADIGGQLDLALAAELAGLDLDTLYAYNPGLNRWATDPAGPHQLLLPAHAVDVFSEALAVIPQDERVRWLRHQVRNGETLSEIAEQYHTTLASIRSANGIRGNTIRAGAHLMIPMASKPLSAYSQSADSRRAKKQNRVRSGNRVDHVVIAGDSFWSIAQRYGVGIRELAAWNGMAPRDTLAIGQKLVVWTQQAVPGNSSAAAGTTRKLNYTVRSGDSLYLIASRFRVTISDLVRWNNIDRNKILRPGQKLTMYVDVTAQSS
ncbi:MAG: LysM peptidoglycan-binding domain-containing protein [Woeseiaceae bacterium]|nr:LysM peptidoglycan-binding domain-containing protein [Woeseiaceae bacterium]